MTPNEARQTIVASAGKSLASCHENLSAIQRHKLFTGGPTLEAQGAADIARYEAAIAQHVAILDRGWLQWGVKPGQ
jgi:hypothetical protein